MILVNIMLYTVDIFIETHFIACIAAAVHSTVFVVIVQSAMLIVYTIVTAMTMNYRQGDGSQLIFPPGFYVGLLSSLSLSITLYCVFFSITSSSKIHFHLLFYHSHIESPVPLNAHKTLLVADIGLFEGVGKLLLNCYPPTWKLKARPGARNKTVRPHLRISLCCRQKNTTPRPAMGKKAFAMKVRQHQVRCRVFPLVALHEELWTL